MTAMLFAALILFAIQERDLIANWFWEITWWKVVVAEFVLGAFFTLVLIRIFS